MGGPRPKEIRVLFVEDDANDAALIAKALARSGWNVTAKRVDEANAMRAELVRQPWDIVLSDWHMPGFGGREALQILKESELDLPFIIVSGAIGEEVAVEMVRSGAHDYVLKHNLVRLGPAVDRELREAQMRGARRELDARLRASEARYRRIIETTNQGVWILDPAMKTTFVNARMADMLGYAPNEILGRSPFDFLEASSRTAFSVDIPKFKDGDRFQSEVCYQHKDGTKLWGLLESTPMMDPNGVFEGGFALVKDITEHKAADEALHASEAKLLERMKVAALSGAIGVALTREVTLESTLQLCADAIVEHTAAAFALIYILDAEKKSLELKAAAGENRSALAPFARVTVSDGFAVGRVVLDRRAFITQDIARDPSNPGREAAVREGLAMFVGHPLRVNDDILGVLAVHARAPLSDIVVDGLGAAADMIAVGLQRNLVEAAKVSLEAQLRQAQKMDAIGQLAGGVAHDFNNVLSVILSYSDLLLDAMSEDDPLRPDIDEIRKAGKRAADLTRQLLMFSRQQVLEPRVLDLNHLLLGMSKMLQRLVGEDVSVSLVPAASVDGVKVDPGSIEQVIMNLVVNARDAMPKGGSVTIETANVVLDDEFVGTHVGATPGPHVRLSVSDTGVGMTTSTQARIFEPFFTTKDRTKGTGLGLSTVFGIVQQSGGGLWVESTVGVGTTFSVYLPRANTAAEAAHASLVPESLSGSETVLLVEDDAQVRAATSSILQRQGYHVVDAGHPAEALILSNQYRGPIHLLLTDVVMPHMSGPDLARLLTASRPEMKLLCMSGYTDDSRIRHGISSAELAYIQKPLSAPASPPRSARSSTRSEIEVRGALSRVVHGARTTRAPRTNRGCTGSGRKRRDCPPRGRSAAEPSPTRSVAEPSPTRSAAEPFPTRSAAEPSPTRSAAEPSPTRSAAKRSARARSPPGALHWRLVHDAYTTRARRTNPLSTRSGLPKIPISRGHPVILGLRIAAAAGYLEAERAAREIDNIDRIVATLYRLAYRARAR